MDRHDEDSNVVQDLGTGGTESVDESLSLTASTSTMLSSPGRRNLMMAVSQSLQSLDPLSLLKPVQQTINCTGNDRESAFSIYGNNVTVYPFENDSSQTVASSKIKFSQVCKYDWEQRYYFGNLIASTTKYVAYVVGGKTENEHVRVINHITSSRVLLKGFEGKVMCLAFGGPTEDHIACMDIVGNLRIFLISEGSQGLDSELVLEVLRNETQLTEYSFVSWAPNLPEDDSEDEGESELVVAITYREKTDVLNVTTIKKIHGSSCSLQDIKNGRQSIHDGHKEPITQLAISPNYEVLATSSLDGYVKMWNINFESEADPSCVHEWLPHDGKPVTGLFFCDNLLSQEENMLSWRFLITGAEFNSEIKVWCSVSWKCLQTVKFSPHPSSSPSDSSKNPHPRLKAVLDKSAVFFILSDIRRQVLYVLQLHQNSQEGAAHFTSLTECLLAQPLLCFSVHYTKTIKKRKQEDEIDGDNADGDEDDNEHNDRDENGIEEDADDDYNNSDALASTGSSAYQVSLKMFGIHVKSLDKLHIKYTPTCSVPPVALSECTAVSSEDFMSIRDGMSDITGEQGSVVSDQEDNDSFATAALKISALEESIKSSRSSLTGVTQSTSSVSQATDYENASIHVDQSEGQDTKKEQVDESTKEEEKEFSREEKDTVSPEEEQKSSIKQGVDTAKEEEPVPVDSSSTELSEAMPSDEKDSEDGARLKKATQMSSSSSSDLNPSKPRKGIITILERPKGLEGEKAMTGNASAGHWNEIKPVSDNELARRQLMADLGIVSPNKSGSPKSGKENKRVLSNRGSSRMPADSVTEKSTGSSSDSSMTIKTGDLLGLGLNGDASSDVRMSAVDAPENSKQMETILKTLQDQEKMMVQMSRRVQELTATLEQQMKRNERLESQRLAEKESMKAALQQIQKNSAPNFNKAVKEITKACSQRIDLLTSTMQTDMKHAQERQMLALLEGVNTAVTGKIEKCLKAEFRSNLLPNFQRPITLAMEQVTSQVSSRLAAMEKTFREEVEAMVASKAVVESLEFSATAVLENTLPNAYRNAFEKVLIPSFEDSCRQMFLQISREFEKGTRSHFERMESYFDSRKQKDLQSRDQVLKQLQGLGQTFQDTADRLTGIENNLLVVMEKQIKDLVNELKKDVVSHLDKSMNQMREELISIGGMASAKETSGYSEDPFDQLNKNIESLDYNNAFTIALNAGDLNMVLYVCQRVDAEDLFSKKGNALSQPVILSLIQQLSAELTIETDLKVNYLSEAITALDQKDEITAEHMPRVLENLSIQVNNATTLLKETEPSNQFIKSLKVLRQLVKAALKGAAH